MDVEEAAHQGFPSNISNPAQRALAAAGYARLEQLADVTEADLSRLHGVGPKVLRLLREALAARGLSFANEAPRGARRMAVNDPER